MQIPKTTTRIINNELTAIIEGINISSDVVISTMGGSGKNVILNNPIINELKFTKDGVSVAKDIKLSNPEQNIGANLLINAANKTVEQCGDGTTTTILFIKALVNAAFNRDIEDKNEFIDNLDTFIEQFEALLTLQSKKIESIDDLYRIAVTSCKSVSIAALIKEIYTKTGFDANITLEQSKDADRTYYDLVEGLNFESGMINSRFANQDNNSCILEDAYLLLEEKMVSSIQAYDKILGQCLKNDHAIVIMAPQFSDEFIRFCITAKQADGLKICLVKSPGYNTYIKENYKDIMAFSKNDTVEKIIITPQNFTMFNRPDSIKLNKRIKQLEKLAEAAIEDYDENDYKSRIHRLKQTGAIIYVGGVTEKNIKEEYDRIEDALGAVSSAIRNGYVRGAGVELIQIIPLFKDSPIFWLIEDVLSRPYKQILENANITRTLKTDVPYNVKTKVYDENIIDALDVLTHSLKNATSLFKLLINTSYVIHNE